MRARHGDRAATAAAGSLPVGFAVAPDRHTRELGPGLLFGGQPARVLRLSGAGREAWQELRGGRISSGMGAVLARRLLDAGALQPRPESPAHASDLEVVVPAKDRVSALDRCLQQLGLGSGVLVVDDGSRAPDRVADVARRHGARLVRREHSGGPAAARNTGLGLTRAPVVAFVDSDALVSRPALEALAAHLADPAVGAVAPRVRAATGCGWRAHYLRARSALDLGPVEAVVRPGGRVTYVPTVALVVRRTALDDVARGTDVFDPDLRFGEDVDLVWRLHDAGWRVRYQPQVEAAHLEPARWVRLLARRFDYGTSAGPLATRHGSRLAPVSLRPWPTAVVALLVARKPLAACATVVGYWLSTWRVLRRAGVPSAGMLRASVRATVETATGLGRAATQLAGAPVVLVALAAPRTRPGIAALVLLPVLRCWWPHRAGQGPVRFAGAMLAEEVAYGAGVWRGAVRSRTWRPLVPVLVAAPTGSSRARGRSIPMSRRRHAPPSTHPDTTDLSPQPQQGGSA